PLRGGGGGLGGLALEEPVGESTNPPRRRVGGYELRMLLLERDELVEEGVVSRVLHDRLVLNVVGDESAVEDVPQLRGPRGGGRGLRGRQGAPRRRQRSRRAVRLPAARGRESGPRSRQRQTSPPPSPRGRRRESRRHGQSRWDPLRAAPRRGQAAPGPACAARARRPRRR